MGKEAVEEAEVKVVEIGEAVAASLEGPNTVRTLPMEFVTAIIDMVQKVGTVCPPTPVHGWTKSSRSHEGPASLEEIKIN